MCDPVTMMAIVAGGTAALKIGGSAISAIGSYNAGVQQDLGAQITAGYMAQNAKIQSGNAELTLGNVDILKQQADVIRDSGEVARAKARVALARTQDQGKVIEGAQVADFSSRNLDPTTGSPLLLQLLTASRVKGDMDLITASAEVERANIRTAAANLDVQAAGEAGKAAGLFSQAASTYGNALSTQLKGGQARTAGMFGAATALLSGAATAISSFGSSGGGGGSSGGGGGGGSTGSAAP